MNSIKRTASILILFLGTLLYTSCETTDMDEKTNPNVLSPEQGDVDFYLNGIQYYFASNVQSYGSTAMEVTRITNMYGRSYKDNYSPAQLDSQWESSYQTLLKNIQLMNNIADAKGLKYHKGIGQVIEAFTIVNLVDFFGDVPYREALNSANLNPKADKGVQIYADAIALLDKAIVNFSGTSNVTPKFNDFYYKKDWAKWINLANTIKMKIYIQSRLVDPSAIGKFDAIVASGKFISSSTGDFQYEWNTNVTNPDSRHPLFRATYLPTGTSGYQSNWFMNLMLKDKSISDPRMKYYFYRQTGSSTGIDPTTLSCFIEPAPQHYIDGGYTFCIADFGYWGRDHGDNDGIPPDSGLKTAYGVYPVGGRFDDDTYKKVSNLAGAKGDGITPILLASTVDFYRAEAALNGGTGDAKALIIAGMNKSFTKVRAFVSRDLGANTAKIPVTTRDVTIMTDVATKFDAAATTAEKMEILAKELFISVYGNGIDAYNFYRRTGYPVKIQPSLEPNPGGFIRSFYYAASETSANSNMPQKANVTTRVFWDNNPATGFPIGN